MILPAAFLWNFAKYCRPASQAKGNQFVAPVVLQFRADFKSILVVMKALYVRGHRRDMIAYANKATPDLISTPHRL